MMAVEWWKDALLDEFEFGIGKAMINNTWAFYFVGPKIRIGRWEKPLAQ